MVPLLGTAIQLIAALALVRACAKVNLCIHNPLEQLPALIPTVLPWAITQRAPYCSESLIIYRS